MDWEILDSKEQLEALIKEQGAFAIFKHSTRCSISSMVKSRVESTWNPEIHNFPIYYLDLLGFRELSNFVADTFNIKHESPQLIIVKDGKAIYNASHTAINPTQMEHLVS